MVIKRITETDDRAGQFINEAFTDFAIKSNVDLNFEEYCFAAENDEGGGTVAGDCVAAVVGGVTVKVCDVCPS